MTTIAADKRSIAWDSLVMFGNREKLVCPGNKVIVRDGVVYGFAGDHIDEDDLIDFVLNHKERHPPKGEFEMFIIKRGGETFYSCDGTPTPLPVALPFAIGSGSQFARGAMLAGASALEATKIAAECDAGTGGDIKTLHFSRIWRKKRRK